MNVRKGFTLIELLIVIAIIGILAGIVIVSLSGSTDNAEDSAVKANLRSVATIYAEVFAENQRDSSKGLSLCTNDKVQAALDSVFTGDPLTQAATTGNGNQDQYLDDNDGTSTKLTALSALTQNGCVSNSSGDWVVWADLSSTEGEAWCVDSNGNNGKVDANTVATETDVYTLSISGTGATAKLNDSDNPISCDSIEA